MRNKFKARFKVGVALLVIGTSFSFLFRPNDDILIKQEIDQFLYRDTNIYHSETNDKNEAIAFYQWYRADQLAVIELNKKRFNWEIVRGVTEGFTGDIQFIQLDYYAVIFQRIPARVVNVEILTQNETVHNGRIVVDEHYQPFWFYYSDTEDLSNAIITTYDEDGEIVEVIDVPDQPNENLQRTITIE
ncbi:hypothetical protein [Amphibacillus cookii]|uniref:hypothetical protein n=1 Tax=Amphibacillus cookii TaxID=767787 RepID=UPI00195CF5D3|nr:hypothetical protein [Amphibacillus cookii]MBM7543039.1 hypothetical protein [Amphibacillus cookii]